MYMETFEGAEPVYLGDSEGVKLGRWLSGPPALRAAGSPGCRLSRPLVFSPRDTRNGARMQIVRADRTNIDDAAVVHAASWKESHRQLCSPDFLELHTPEHQRQYLLEKMGRGSTVYMLVDEGPVGVVSVTGNLIEDLYVLPDQQNRGYGTQLLLHAISSCEGTPTLWILETNTDAERLYQRLGFKRTGRRHIAPKGVDEIELVMDRPT